MAVDIQGLLDGLNIKVPQPGDKPRRTRASQIVPVASNNKPSKPKVSSPNSFGSGAGKYQPTVKFSTPTTPEDDDSAWSVVGDIFKKALDAVDTPRAFVAATLHQGASSLLHTVLPGSDSALDSMGFDSDWGSISRNTWANKGFGSYLHDSMGDADGSGEKWFQRVAGFAGDVGLDPLTYTAPGARGGTEAIEQAVKAGGREAIAKEIAVKAAEVGVDADKLIASAARKGRGALTKGAVQKTGMAVEDVEKLGLGRLNREIFGMAIPGSTKVAEGLEATKGLVKELVGSSKFARAWRALRVPADDGRLAFVNAIRSSSGDVVKQADAVRSLAAISTAKSASRKWGYTKMETLLKSDLGKVVKEGDESLIHEAERPGVRNALNDWLDEVHGEATAFGVEVPYRENYVPHYLTPEASKLSRTDDSVRVLVESLSTKEAFQKSRQLQQTIAEANADFAVKHPGVKLFETDPGTILVRYVKDVEDSITRGVANGELAKLGTAVPLTEKELTKNYDAAAVKDALKELKRTEKVEAKAAQDGLTLLEHQAEVASKALNEKAGRLQADISKIDAQIKDVARRKNVATKKVELLQSQVDVLTKKRDGWIAIVKRERGPKRAEAMAKLRRVEKQLAEATTGLETAKGKLDWVTNRWVAEGRPKGMVGQAKGFAAETKRLAAERDALQAEHVATISELEKVKLTTTKPGEGELLSDLQVKEANTRLAEVGDKLVRAKSDEAIVQNVYDIMLADRDAVKPLLDAQLADVEKAVAAIPKRRPTPKRLSAVDKHAAEISNNLRLARDILDADLDPAASMIAQLDAAAAMADAKRLTAGMKADSIRATIDTLKDPKFRKYMQKSVDAGMTRINETHQIPDWIDQALQAKHILNDPKRLDELTRFYDRGLNVLKGYMIARPGFVVRNAYSSLFNVYLEGGIRSMGSVKRYERFYRMFKKNPETYLEEATRVWGAETASKLDRALSAQASQGFGQAADEVAIKGLGARTLNPLDANFAPIRGVRKANEVVEEIIRGGHAYDVLERGGSDMLAAETLAKWHFNYSDLTDFDRKMKRVMPFWMFFSRNLALQAETFPRILPKLNRTYFNAQRNLSLGEEPDTLTPQWMDKSMPLRLPGGDGSSSVRYLFPDLPALQAVGDIGSIIDSKGRSLLGQTAPPIKIFTDAIVGDKQSYSGIPFSDKPRPSYLPDWLPGVDTGGLSGEPVWTDRTQYVYENAIPTLGQADRLAGSKSSIDNLLSWLGVSTRTNNESTRKSEAARQKREAASRAKSKKDLEES